MANFAPKIENEEEIRNIEPMTLEKASAQMPMKFYKHLITWLLWVAIAANVSQGILYLTGVYSSGISVLSTLERINGGIGIIIAIILFFARMQLKSFKASGITLLYSALVVNLLGSAFFALRADALLSTMSFVHVKAPGLISTIIPRVVVLVLCSTYFSKRKHLFYN